MAIHRLHLQRMLLILPQLRLSFQVDQLEFVEQHHQKLIQLQCFIAVYVLFIEVFKTLTDNYDTNVIRQLLKNIKIVEPGGIV